MRARDGEWRMRARDGGVQDEGWGVENESEGWGKGCRRLVETAVKRGQ